MIDYIRDFMSNCPCFGDVDATVNCLYEDSVGGISRQCVFIVDLRQEFGQDAAVNTAAISRLEQIVDWIKQQSNVGILPVLENGCNPISLEIIKTGWQKDIFSCTAKYRIKCRLLYYHD